MKARDFFFLCQTEKLEQGLMLIGRIHVRGTVDSRGKRDFENGHGMVCRCGGVRIREEKQHLLRHRCSGLMLLVYGFDGEKLREFRS